MGKLTDNYNFRAKIGEGAHRYLKTAVHKLSGQEKVIKSIDKFKFIGEIGKNQFLNETTY